MGKYGKVSRGFSIFRNFMVAVRVCHKGDGHEPLLEVLEANKQLNHSFVMSYYGQLKKEDKLYIFLEMCPNGTLRDLIRQGIPEI
jgi:serine/threonine protein kinase